MLHGKGSRFYCGCEQPKEDHIAREGMFKCAPVGSKLINPATQQPLRHSEKPVVMLMYLITTLVRLWRA